MYSPARAFLTRHRADRIPHLDGDLLSHLERVARLLECWEPGAAVHRRTRHAAYGTEGFAVALVGSDRREELARAIGTEVRRLEAELEAIGGPRPRGVVPSAPEPSQPQRSIISYCKRDRLGTENSCTSIECGRTRPCRR
jgi:hypothetical protein